MILFSAGIDTLPGFFYTWAGCECAGPEGGEKPVPAVACRSERDEKNKLPDRATG